jgi:CRISPR-associated protein Csm3
MDLQFKGKYVLSGHICCVTGLHVGGATEGIEIGGVENTVIKDPLTEWPYIPGSSLKGKLRNLLEWSLDKVEEHPKHSKGDEKVYGPHFCGECDACVIFGPASDDTKVRIKAGPTRLTVRDSFPLPEVIANWEEWLGEGVYTEIKTENTIDRVTSEANPRPMERVPAGSVFRFEMIFDVYRADDRRLFESLFKAMHLLEDSALGGSGSRGHGQVRFEKLGLEWRPLDYYKTGKGAKPVPLPGQSVKDLVGSFSTIQWP